MKRILVILLASILLGVLILAFSYWAPLPIPYYQDFSVLYFANHTLLRGVELYDYPAQLAMVRAETQSEFTFHPYPYPPWYALATIYLAWLPIEVAARAWFLLNMGMIAAAAWLLTPRWKPLLRVLAIPAAILFIPTLGLLLVGQYSVPVLLGVALLLAAIQRQSPVGIAMALGLLTFKPHIGLPLALAATGWLLIHRRAAFARRALWLTTGLALLLAAIAFLADSAWPLTYLESLGRYRELPGVQSCGLCASLSVALVGLLSGQANVLQGALLSLGLAVGLGGLFAWRFRSQLKNAALLIILVTALTLLVDPYLLNYDYILLLAPLAGLSERSHSKSGYLMLAAAYLLPWGMLIWGRTGNILLPIATLLVLALTWRQSWDVEKTPQPNSTKNCGAG